MKIRGVFALVALAGAFALTVVGQASAQCQPQWLPGDGIPGVDGYVNTSIMWDPDGAGPLPKRLVVGGLFSHAGSTLASNIAMWDGSNWVALGGGTNGEVHALLVDGNGNLIVGGKFVTAGGGQGCSHIARWDGSVWSTLDAGFNNNVYALLAMPNGDIIAGGIFSVLDGVSPIDGTARWNGTSWTALHNPHWSGLQIGGVYALALMPNGDIAAGGTFLYADYDKGYGVARWDGTTWIPMGQSNFGPTFGLAVAPNGDLIAAGMYIINNIRSAVARWDGSGWSGFPENPDWEINAAQSIKMLPDGQFYIGGNDFFELKGRVTRWDGAAWNNFATTGMGDSSGSVVMTVTLMPDGGLFAGGSFREMEAEGADGVASWDSQKWSALGKGANQDILATLTLANGDIIAGGRFITIGGIKANRIARWNGVSWSPLGAGTDSTVKALAALPNGDIVAGGEFLNAGGVSANRIAKWNGSTWSALSSGMTGGTTPRVNALAVSASGDIVAGGLFTNAGGVTAANAARWNGTAWSGLATTMTGPTTPPGEIFSAIFFGNGDLVISGSFYSINGGGAYTIARWNGATWSKMSYGLSSPARGLALQTDGRLVAAGSIFAAGEGFNGPLPYDGVARWSGVWAPIWTLSSDTWLMADMKTISALPNTGLVVGGKFASAGGVLANNIIRKGTSTWSAMDSGTAGKDPTVYATNVLSGKEIVAAGAFVRAGGLPAGHFARWSDLPKPWIALRPSGQTEQAGDTLNLSATPASGYSGISYQWQRNGVPVVNGSGGASAGGGTVSGASGLLPSPTDGTPAPLTISSVQPSDAGNYTVVFTNACGSATSDTVAVIVTAACPADLNSDGFVDDQDFVLFVAAYNLLDCTDPAMPAGCAADLNADALVDDSDFVLFVPAYNALVCP